MRHQLHTEIIIAAPIARVWAILSDVAEYPAWNPFVLSVAGQLKQKEQLTVSLRGSGSRPMKLRPRVCSYTDGVEFAWRGSLPIPGLFEGEHHFALDSQGEGQTRFRQFENFQGLLVPLLKRTLDGNVRKSFVAMNEALKRRAETSA